MFVKSLRLAGFKSFASPTILEFESGVNVIVGPNGSGKSNIADALSWVLGSQAPSSLRGASMEDVIFAGSSGKSRLPQAEVELTLDNTSRVLPLDLNEVTISRFTDRSGASEYRINGAPCRLLDIAELLSDTGIGRSIHTVVGQGQLDAVLQARPEDRRAFIEEAAQIGKYRRRKDRALRKIERVDDNLNRQHDLDSEIRRAIGAQKRDAKPNTRKSKKQTKHKQLTIFRTVYSVSSEILHRRRRRTTPRRTGIYHNSYRRSWASLEPGWTLLRERQAVKAAEEASGMAHRMARASDRPWPCPPGDREGREDHRRGLAAETEEGWRDQAAA